MTNKITKWINPLIVLIALSLTTQVFQATLIGSVAVNIQIIANFILLFVFGIFLSYRRRKSTTWVRKVIITILMLWLLLIKLSIMPEFSLTLISQWIRLNDVIIYALVIYFGWAFFE